MEHEFNLVSSICNNCGASMEQVQDRGFPCRSVEPGYAYNGIACGSPARFVPTAKWRGMSFHRFVGVFPCNEHAFWCSLILKTTPPMFLGSIHRRLVTCAFPWSKPKPLTRRELNFLVPKIARLACNGDVEQYVECLGMLKLWGVDPKQLRELADV